MTRVELETIIENAVLNTLGTDPDTGELLMPTPGYMGFRVVNIIESEFKLRGKNKDFIHRLEEVLEHPLTEDQTLKILDIL